MQNQKNITMFEIYNQLDPFLKVYWVIAIFSSLVFIIQAIMTFVGAGSDDLPDADFNADADGGDMPFQLFSFRNLTHFMLGFGWTGISFYNVISSKIVLGLISFLVGLFFIFLFFVIIKQLMKLSENNSFQIEETIGKTGEVYLTIPAAAQGKGKVMVSVRNVVHELSAMTRTDEKIETGAIIKIDEVSDNILVVSKI